MPKEIGVLCARYWLTPRATSLTGYMHVVPDSLDRPHPSVSKNRPTAILAANRLAYI